MARFDSCINGGNWHRTFDFTNGADMNNVWIGKAAGKCDMRFEILKLGRK